MLEYQVHGLFYHLNQRTHETPLFQCWKGILDMFATKPMSSII